MIPTTTLFTRDAAAPEARGPGAADAPESASGFLAALGDALQEGETELTPTALMDWLQSGGGRELPQADGLVPLLAELEPGAADGDAASGQDPLGLLGLILDFAGGQAGAGRPGGGLLPRAGGGAAGAEALLLGRLAQAAGSADDAEAFRNLLDPGAGATPAQPGAGTPAGPLAETLPEIRSPVTSPRFGQEVGERVIWMAKEGVQQARVQVNPPGLGPVELSVQVQEDGAKVTVTAQHALTREVLAADVPRLRAMLEDQGFAQVDVSVSQDSAGGTAAEDDTGRGQGGSGPRAGAPEPEGGDAGALPAATVLAGRGLVDHYV